MNIFVTGVNYKTTPLEIREKLSFNTVSQRHALMTMHDLAAVDECILLSTCNRTEVYVFSNDSCFDSSIIEKALCEIKAIELSDMIKHFYSYRDKKAVKHLFKVASGLDSMVLGEDQILGQVKGAYELSLELQTSSGVLNTLFRDVITAAKKVKTHTGLSRNSLSIGSLAVKLAADIFDGKLEDKRVLVIGAGKIGSIILKNLSFSGLEKLYATTRTHGKIEDMSKNFTNVTPIDYNLRYSFINECDIILSSTSSPHYTITSDVLEKSIMSKKKRLFIDLAVPRDIDSDITKLDNVLYYNIDQLKAVSDENNCRRIGEAERAEQIIDEYSAQYEKWYEFRSILPVVRHIQKYADTLAAEKISGTIAKLKSSNEEDKELVKLTITNTVNEMLNKFIYSVRENAGKDEMLVYFNCLKNSVGNL